MVQTAVDSAANSATTVVGEDTDLLVLLCLHADVVPNQKKSLLQQLVAFYT